MTVAENALNAGVPLWWTRTDPLPKASAPDLEKVEALVARTGSTVTTYTFRRNNATWLLQRADRRPS